MVILRKLRDTQALLRGAALQMVFFDETSHCVYAKAKASLGERENYRALSFLLKTCFGGFA